MGFQGYGSLLSSLTSILLDKVIVKVEVLSSLQRKVPPSLTICSFRWDLTRGDLSFRFVCLFVCLFFARVSWLSIPKLLSWALQPYLNALRADSGARILFRAFVIL